MARINSYNEWRRKVLVRDNYTCQHCGEKPKTLHSHHVKSFTEFESLRYDVNNGIVLCKACHIAIHRIEGKGKNLRNAKWARYR